MINSEFEEQLRTKLKPFPKARPFVCNGNPLESEVFIVGINAATEMNKSFWEFWTSENGFDKKLWLAEYVLERSRKPLKPNRTRRNRLSNTRQRIEWITEEIVPFKTLETNIFVKATPSALELKKEDRESLVFEYLLEKIKPKLIFTHGKDAKEHLERLFDIQITKDEINTFEIMGVNTKIIAMNHLSRGWSKTKSKEIGKTIKSFL